MLADKVWIVASDEIRIPHLPEKPFILDHSIGDRMRLPCLHGGRERNDSGLGGKMSFQGRHGRVFFGTGHLIEGGDQRSSRSIRNEATFGTLSWLSGLRVGGWHERMVSSRLVYNGADSHIMKLKISATIAVSWPEGLGGVKIRWH